MAQPQKKVALIINSASYERVAFALSLATAAAALGKEVSVLFGYGGLVRLKKGFTDQVGAETDGWIREQIKAGLEKGSVSPISELLETLRRLGGKLYACPTAMALHNLISGELVAEVNRVCGLVQFLTEDAEDASMTIYV